MTLTKPDGQHSRDNETQHALVSVIIPVYNREEYIGAAINSVLNQDYPSIEIIVVDDGSTDSTPEILKSFESKITVLNQPNKGPSAARNFGIRHASGSVIGLLDSDDLWPEGRLTALIPYIKEGHSIVRGLTRYIRDEGTEKQSVSEYHVVAINVGACLYDATVFTNVGPFDETMVYAEDLDWDIRSRECGYTELQVPVPALQHRRHDTNLTNIYEKVHQGKIRAFEKKVLRAQQRNQ
ncbi:MAG TPA: glycosyltransferase family 2 protein [Candidatus Paceibacterota bacterium]|nr:glycosyltransferase family 2 protein [Candidatus Paceibacterota bacterium]